MAHSLKATSSSFKGGTDSVKCPQFHKIQREQVFYIPIPYNLILHFYCYSVYIILQWILFNCKLSSSYSFVYLGNLLVRSTYIAFLYYTLRCNSTKKN